MPALNFARQFAEPVASGKKPQTIRRKRKWPIKAGDRLVLYTGQRTKRCEKLLETTCWFTRDVYITESGVKLDGVALSASEVKVFAKQDGFDDPLQMRAWFRDHYGLPFEGQLIAWKWSRGAARAAEAAGGE